MKTSFSALAISLALVSIGAAPATAADMGGHGPGSIKDRGPGGVPVPAPVPYEEHYKFYVGVGTGWAFKATGDIGLSAGGAPGLSYGDVGDFKGPFGVSLYAGRYITPSLRAEIGLDLRKERQRTNTMAYQATLTGQHDFGGVTGVQNVTNTYDMSRDEDARIRNHTAMFNLYYDMNRGGRFNPYVGAGVGISYMHLGRASTETIVGCEGSPDPVTPPVPPATQPCWAGGANGSPTMPTGLGANTTATSAQAGWGLAAALMTGVTYNISERTHLDMGYRLIYQSGKVLVASSSLGTGSGPGSPFTGVSVMNIGSRVDHELRAGIRWDLW